jgi:hypothetical protein
MFDGQTSYFLPLLDIPYMQYSKQDLHNVHCSPNIIRMVKSSRRIGVGHEVYRREHLEDIV